MTEYIAQMCEARQARVAAFREHMRRAQLAWQMACQMLDTAAQELGWEPLPGRAGGDGELLVTRVHRYRMPAHHPLLRRRMGWSPDSARAEVQLYQWAWEDVGTDGSDLPDPQIEFRFGPATAQYAPQDWGLEELIEETVPITSQLANREGELHRRLAAALTQTYRTYTQSRLFPVLEEAVYSGDYSLLVPVPKEKIEPDPDVTAIPAGPELDALVVDQVMGWSVLVDDLPDLDGTYWCVQLNDEGEGAIRPVPPFSTDLAAAWSVVELLHTRLEADRNDEGWQAAISYPACPLQLVRWGENWCAAFEAEADWYVHSDFGGNDLCARAETAPLAICRAALLAARALVAWTATVPSGSSGPG